MVLFLWIVALATIAALSAALMVLISAAVGILLRFTHQDIAPRHLFVLVRRYGLWRGLYTLARIAWPKRFHLFSRGSSDNWWTALMIVVVVPGCGFVAASFLPVIAAALLPHDYSSGFVASVLARTALLDGIIGAVLATYVWLVGLVYVARPPLSLPSGLSRAGRDHLAINIYWHYRVKTAAIFAACYPWLFFGVAFAGLSGNSSASGCAPR